MSNNNNTLIFSKKKDFSKWYSDIVKKAKLIHYSPVKGFVSFLPNSWRIWESIQNWINKKFAELKIYNLSLPTLFPFADIQLEKQHVEGFKPELFVIRDETNTFIEYALRPTSEVIISRLFSETIQSVNQLPVVYNHWGNVFRKEKNTRPFLRNSEFHWQEVHGSFSNYDSAEELVIKILNIYETLLTDILLIPTLRGKKTENEKFAGAHETYTLESIMPDGQVLQCCTSHNLGQFFSKAFDIKFQNSANEFEYAWTMSAGISTRIIGALIMTHSDDFGLVIPWQIAPTQIIINVIDYDQKNDKFINDIKNKLNKTYRVDIDITNKTFGHKLTQFELEGIPIQIIIGKKEIENDQVLIYDRLTRNKKNISTSELDYEIKEITNVWMNERFDYLKQKMENELIVSANSYDDFVKFLNDSKVILAPWGGDLQDEIDLKSKHNITARCIKENISSNSGIKCFFTNKPAKHYVYFGRAY